MGYSDLSCYGGEALTPNLDQLAKEGLRYTQFYNMSRCCPSRASLLTGLYPHQAGMGYMTSVDFHLPGYRGNINNNCVTISEVLKENGYETFMTGKWHLNLHPTATSSKENWPLQRGFNKYYGTILGASNYYDPGFLCRDNTLITPANDPKYKSDNYYFTDAISDNSVKYIQERDYSKPFFMYVAYTAAHWPMQAPQKAIDKYKGRFDEGWEKLREERLVRMKKLGVIKSDTELSPINADNLWETETNKPAMLRRMETYAAMIDIMDQGIGRIITQLKKDDIFDNTVIMFMQDNGACAENIGSGALRPVTKIVKNLATLQPNDLNYSNTPPITRKGEVVMQGKSVMAGPANTYLSYLKSWANVSNTPLQLFKHDVSEGGIATPLIIHWPAGIAKSSEGTIRSQVGHTIDIMPTILEITGSPYPKNFADHQIIPEDGISLVPSFKDKELRRKAIFWEHEMNRAVRMGKWKIVSAAHLKGRKYTSDPWELYDIEVDRPELNNLATLHPAIVKEMSEMWEDYAVKKNVFPSPWTKAK